MCFCQTVSQSTVISVVTSCDMCPLGLVEMCRSGRTDPHWLKRRMTDEVSSGKSCFRHSHPWSETAWIWFSSFFWLFPRSLLFYMFLFMADCWLLATHWELHLSSSGWPERIKTVFSVSTTLAVGALLILQLGCFLYLDVEVFLPQKNIGFHFMHL